MRILILILGFKGLKVTCPARDVLVLDYQGGLVSSPEVRINFVHSQQVNMEIDSLFVCALFSSKIRGSSGCLSQKVHSAS